MLAIGKCQELQKYDRNKKNAVENEESCSVVLQFYEEELQNLKVKELKEDLKAPKLKVGGKKQEAYERLLKHYQECHEDDSEML